MIVRTYDHETKTDAEVFKATERSSVMVVRCPHCDDIHILMFKDRDDKIAAACVDITDAMAEILIAELVRRLAEARVRQPGETLN